MEAREPKVVEKGEEAPMLLKGIRSSMPSWWRPMRMDFDQCALVNNRPISPSLGGHLPA